jgi:hypothetical protein
MLWFQPPLRARRLKHEPALAVKPYSCPVALPDCVIAETAQWLLHYSDDWRLEMPIRIHSASFDAGGTPQWHPEFEVYLTRKPGSDRNPPNPEDRLKLTRAMRLVRKAAVREFEVLYRVMVLGLSVESTTAWLNERSIRGGHPERYEFRDTVVIIVSGVHKLREWAS